MTKTYLMVFSNPIDGKEDAYNRWYTDVHLPEILRVDGLVAAQRFKLSDTQQFPQQIYQYLAIYEAAEGQIAGALEKLQSASAGMAMEPVIDLENIKVTVFESITDLLVKT